MNMSPVYADLITTSGLGDGKLCRFEGGSGAKLMY
jgi:hypothetical protein